MSAPHPTPTNSGPYAKHRLEMYLRHGFASPFRIGISVGECGEQLPNPYAYGSRAFRNYDDGVKEGMRRRAKTTRSTP